MSFDVPLSLLAGGFLITYLVHSTLLLSCAWLLVRFHRRMAADVRCWLWKAALLGGIVASLAMTFAPLPHFGRQFALTVESERVMSTAPATAPALHEPSPATRTPIVARADASVAAEHPVESTTLGLAALSVNGSATLLACRALLAVWLIGAAAAMLRIGLDWLRLSRLIRRSRPITTGPVAELAQALALRVGCRVELREVAGGEEVGPLAAGIVRHRIFVPRGLLQKLDREQLEALVAHEMAHVARRDPLWTLIASLVCGLLFVQPLNFLARRRLLAEAEYLADRRAVELATSRIGLARCLASLGEWLLDDRRRATLAAGSAGIGMASYRSNLGRRIEAILSADDDRPRRFRLVSPALMCVALVLLPLAAPRAAATLKQPSSLEQKPGTEPMIRTLTTAALLAGLAAPAAAEESTQDEKPQAQVVAVPESVHGFRGQIVGKIVSKDVEQGSLVLDVQRVERVWKNNTAKRPADSEGKRLALDGLFGKWLDVLLVVQPGDTVRIEAKHVSGDKLAFLGELFEKTAPVSDEKAREDDQASAGDGQDDGAFPAGLRGFRGILVGTVVDTDIEKGVLVFKAESVKRTWPKNTAKNPASAKGKTLTVNGIAGKWLDVLLSFKQGDRIEVEAFHNRGEALDFVQEWLKKAEQ